MKNEVSMTPGDMLSNFKREEPTIWQKENWLQAFRVS